MRGQRDPEDTSQSREEAPRGTETRLRDREDLIFETDEQDSWKARTGGNCRKREQGQKEPAEEAGGSQRKPEEAGGSRRKPEAGKETPEKKL